MNCRRPSVPASILYATCIKHSLTVVTPTPRVKVPANRENSVIQCKLAYVYVKANLNWIKVRTRLYAFSGKPPYFISFLLCRSFDFVGHGGVKSVLSEHTVDEFVLVVTSASRMEREPFPRIYGSMISHLKQKDHDSSALLM
ncbi:hypothetical protein KC364_g37 [Hortaea werneckii]|nr:hypothetical protein KC364_g37 [Hortaea werneckii]